MHNFNLAIFVRLFSVDLVVGLDGLVWPLIGGSPAGQCYSDQIPTGHTQAFGVHNDGPFLTLHYINDGWYR